MSPRAAGMHDRCVNTRSTFDPALPDGGGRQQVLAWTGLAGGIAPVLFAAAAVLLSWANSSYLRDYGWTVSNHHGVPWPSSLAIGPHGWLMIVTFGACANSWGDDR